MPPLFSGDWIVGVNDLLADHDTGTVTEFSLVVEVRLTDAEPDQVSVGYLIMSESRLQFAAAVSVEPDSRVTLSRQQAVTLVATGAGDDSVVNAVISQPGVVLGGDPAKLLALADGVIRGADSSITSAVQALTS